MWENIKYKYALLKQLFKKSRQLREVQMDILFLQEFKNAYKITTDINSLRADLKLEQGKKEKADQRKVTDLAYEIAGKEKLKENYESLVKVAMDLEGYISLLKTWIKQ